jgi:serine/threonine protein kinase
LAGLCTGFRWSQEKQMLTSMRCACPAGSCVCGLSADSAAASSDASIRAMANSLVGTPNYIAPEVFGQEGYGNECDWWSVGVLLYEMLFGKPPFAAPSPWETRQRVLNWRVTLVLPEDPTVDRHARNLIERLCCDAPSRLGAGADGVAALQAHPFFARIEWSRTNEPPFVPPLENDTDTSNFLHHDTNSLSRDSANGNDAGVDALAFPAFTFRRFWDDRTASYRSSSYMSTTTRTASHLSDPTLSLRAEPTPSFTTATATSTRTASTISNPRRTASASEHQ